MKHIIDILFLYNPFTIGKAVTKLIEESTILKDQLDSTIKTLETVTKVIDTYEALLQEAEYKAIRINTEKLHIIETILIYIDDDLCDDCRPKNESIKDYLLELHTDILKDTKRKE